MFLSLFGLISHPVNVYQPLSLVGPVSTSSKIENKEKLAIACELERGARPRFLTLSAFCVRFADSIMVSGDRVKHCEFERKLLRRMTVFSLG